MDPKAKFRLEISTDEKFFYDRTRILQIVSDVNKSFNTLKAVRVLLGISVAPSAQRSYLKPLPHCSNVV